VYSDHRVEEFAAGPRAAYQARLASGMGYDAEHARLLRELRAHLCTGRNRQGGFWVAEAEPEAARHALTIDIDPNHITDAAICTDGASAVVDTYGLVPDWSTALDLMRDKGPMALIAASREAELADREARRWPRGKVHDDATAVYLQLRQ
jgi:hypothetical protein